MFIEDNFAHYMHIIDVDQDTSFVIVISKTPDLNPVSFSLRLHCEGEEPIIVENNIRETEFKCGDVSGLVEIMKKDFTPNIVRILKQKNDENVSESFLKIVKNDILKSEIKTITYSDSKFSV